MSMRGNLLLHSMPLSDDVVMTETKEEKREEKRSPVSASVVLSAELKSSSSFSLTIPDEVDIKDIEDNNGRFYPPGILKFLEEELVRKPDGKYNKHQVREMLAKYDILPAQLHYAVMKKAGKLRVIYRGETWGAKNKKTYIAGKGSFGKVKHIDGSNGSNWLVGKIQKEFKVIEDDRTCKKTVSQFPEDYKPGDSLEFKMIHKADPDAFEEMYVSKKGRKLFTITEYIPHMNLSNIVRDKKLFNFSEHRFLKLIVAMARQIQKIHQSGRLHRDIKPENFRFNFMTGEPILIDFGLALDVGKPIKRDTVVTTDTGVGTGDFMPPELIAECERFGKAFFYSAATDVYSFGETILDMVSYGCPDHRVFREDINSITSLMMARSADGRISLSDSIVRFEKLLEKYPPTPFRSMELDIHMFINLSPEAKAVHLLKLREVDQVKIFDSTENYTIYDHYRVQRALYQNGVRIGEHVFPAVDMTVISPAEKELVLNLLDKEIVRLKNKYGKKNGETFQKRFAALTKIMFEVDREIQISNYPRLISALENLKEEMHHIAGCLPKHVTCCGLFSRRVTGQGEIQAIIDKLEMPRQQKRAVQVVSSQAARLNSSN